MSLEPFQAATVAAAVAALTDPAGSRRFLIADEVGLGKTVAAKAVAEALRARRRRPLNIVYLCPSLEIATQNLGKFASLEPGWKQPEDRLSLMAAAGQEAVRGYRIYCYTPDTSLPGWRGGQRTGRLAERALIASLIARAAPRAWRYIRAIETKHVRRGFRPWFPALAAEPKGLRQDFAAALGETLQLPAARLDTHLKLWLQARGDDIAELILRARAALALVALRQSSCHPDLVILDEFHRYADLIIATPSSRALTRLEVERRHVHQLLVAALCGKGRAAAAILLLSATPYRLQGADRRPLPGGRYSHFISLAQFLKGGEAADHAAMVRTAIAEHHEALGARGDQTDALRTARRTKQALEALLRPHIARTESATAIEGDLFHRMHQPAAIEPRDLHLFGHLARAAR
ncbi:MAG TPA: DEAD/DEAH box helicase family protein, partial [Sphingopyxis sp.]|nr:DEAD/DEAH box helicase family protein [Sphingopyxis sp.]